MITQFFSSFSLPCCRPPGFSIVEGVQVPWRQPSIKLEYLYCAFSFLLFWALWLLESVQQNTTCFPSTPCGEVHVWCYSLTAECTMVPYPLCDLNTPSYECVHSHLWLLVVYCSWTQHTIKALLKRFSFVQTLFSKKSMTKNAEKTFDTLKHENYIQINFLYLPKDNCQTQLQLWLHLLWI